MICPNCTPEDPIDAAGDFMQRTIAARHILMFFQEVRWQHGDDWERHAVLHSQLGDAAPLDVLFSAAEQVRQAAQELVEHVEAWDEERRQEKPAAVPQGQR
jgi:ABC-type histidine transport system ATPase subunit